MSGNVKKKQEWRRHQIVAAIVDAQQTKRKNMKFKRGECQPPERIQNLLLNGKTEAVLNLDQPQQMEKPWIDSLAEVKAAAAAAPPKKVTPTFLPKSTRELLHMKKNTRRNFLADAKKTQPRGWLKIYERTSSPVALLTRLAVHSDSLSDEEQILVGHLRHKTHGKCVHHIAQAWGITVREVINYWKKYQEERNEHAGRLEGGLGSCEDALALDDETE